MIRHKTGFYFVAGQGVPARALEKEILNNKDKQVRLLAAQYLLAVDVYEEWWENIKEKS